MSAYIKQLKQFKQLKIPLLKIEKHLKKIRHCINEITRNNDNFKEMETNIREVITSNT